MKTLLRKIGKILLRLFLFVAGIGIISLAFLSIVSPGKTEKIADESGSDIPGSIAEMTFVEIGGVEQWILVRGKSVDNPVLLILHGGPGSPEAPMFNYYNRELEDRFVVVNWDQRGAGKSRDVPDESISVDQIIADTHDLTQYLKDRFSQKKIYLLGHSWGSFLGIRVASLSPDDYYAYIGTGQLGNQANSELESYQFVLQKAHEMNNEEAIQQLEAMGTPVGGMYGESMEESLKNMMIQRNWVMEFGGAAHNMNRSSVGALLIKPLLLFREYSIADKMSYFPEASRSSSLMWPDVVAYDLTEEITELEVPVYILQGVDDYQTSFAEAQRYFELIEAPQKEFIVFENSGHMVPFEEIDKFHDVLFDQVLPETLP